MSGNIASLLEMRKRSQTPLTHDGNHKGLKKEFTSFSYDEKHIFRLDDSSLKYYYPPLHLPVDLCKGFESFVKHDDSIDEHLVSLLKAIQSYEQQEGKKIDADVVTWRGMMTKVCAILFEY